ncbi:hypothetical protein [Fibrobacter sp.]|uniref:hypothetical protein n=1 Tax=Fibrobacter sp. TaxID=35828 RepID=UPI00388F17A9
MKSFKFFQRLVAAPYLLALLGLLLPLFNVSCADDVIAEPSFYEVASGLNLEESLKEPALSYLKKMEDGNPAALEKFKAVMPEFPHVQPVHHLYGIAGALVLAAVFAWLAPLGFWATLGSLSVGLLSMVSLWALLSQVVAMCEAIGMKLLTVNPAQGIYCASALILIGTAMNLAVIVRPIVAEMKERKKKNKK